MIEVIEDFTPLPVEDVLHMVLNKVLWPVDGASGRSPQYALLLEVQRMLEVQRDKHTDGIQVLTLTGEFDLFQKRQVEDHLAAAAVEVPKGLVIDLTPVSFLDSSGIGVLFAYYGRLKQHGISMALVVDHNNYVIRKLGRLLSMAEAGLKFFETTEEAKNAILA